MSRAEALDVFKRGLKERVRNEVIVNKVIACAQYIVCAYDITNCEIVTQTNDLYDLIPMELDNITRKKCYTSQRYGRIDRRSHYQNL